MTTVYLFGEGLFQKDDFWLSFNIVRDLNSDFVTCPRLSVLFGHQVDDILF